MNSVFSLVRSEAAAVEPPIQASRKTAGRWLVRLASLGLGLVILVQVLFASGTTSVGFENWRPVLYGFLAWGVALGAGQIMTRGEAGKRAVFLLPAVLFTLAMVIFPTFFGLYLAFTDWNLSSAEGARFNGLENLRMLFSDAFYRNALGNMVFYVLSVLIQYAVAFGLALLLNAEN